MGPSTVATIPWNVDNMVHARECVGNTQLQPAVPFAAPPARRKPSVMADKENGRNLMAKPTPRQFSQGGHRPTPTLLRFPPGRGDFLFPRRFFAPGS
jgi:hypothetical protein